MIRINLAPPSAKKTFAVPDFNLGMLFGVLALGLILILGGWWWSVKDIVCGHRLAAFRISGTNI